MHCLQSFKVHPAGLESLGACMYGGWWDALIERVKLLSSAKAFADHTYIGMQ